MSRKENNRGRCDTSTCFVPKRNPDGTITITRVLHGEQVGKPRELSPIKYEFLATAVALGLPARLLAMKGEARGAAGLNPTELGEEARGLRRSLWNPSNEVAPRLPAMLARVVRRGNPAPTPAK